LIYLLEVAATHPHPDRFGLGTSILEVIEYLVSRSSDIRSKVKAHLESGLFDAQKPVTEAMEHAFPTLPEAWRYLKRQVDAGKLAKLAPETPAIKRLKHDVYHSYQRGSVVQARPPDIARDPILKTFCDKAGWTAADEYESDEEEDRIYYSDDDDEDIYHTDRYDNQAEKEDISASVITTLQSWVKVLDNWPDAVERDIMKKTIRVARLDSQVFFDVDGVADVLARWCDHGSEPCRKQLGRAIRQLYYSFAKEGAEKERIKKEMGI